MFEQMLIAINDMMQTESGLAFIGCFFWGCISTLLSPCHLASIPLLVSYAAGQKMTMTPRNASAYSILFSLGLFAALFVIGGVCTLLGRMLGDMPDWIYAATGLLLIAMGIQRLRRKSCNIPYDSLFSRNLSGYTGAFLLGLMYGVLSGVCTFGFLAPMLAVITYQHRIAAGIAMAAVFGLGHCTPIIAAGCGFGLVQTHYLHYSDAIRTVSSIVIIAIGLYFLLPSSFFGL